MNSQATEPKQDATSEPRLAVVPKIKQQLQELGIRFRANCDQPTTIQEETPLSDVSMSFLNLPKISELRAEMTWLVDGLIPEKSVVMLSGESGCGKSTIALVLADAVAHGKPFLSRRADQRHVLILDRENSAATYTDRLKRLNIEENNFLHIWGRWLGEAPGPVAEGAQRGKDGDDLNKELEKLAVEVQPLIIFDSFIAFNPGNEQDATETRRFMKNFGKLAESGATILFIHHSGKGENTKEYRGSSDIKANLDVGLLLTQKQPLLRALELRPIKAREGIVEPIDIASDDGAHFVATKDRDRETVENIIRETPGINTSHICEAAQTISKKRIKEILDTGERAGYFRKTKGQSNSSCYTLEAS